MSEVCTREMGSYKTLLSVFQWCDGRKAGLVRNCVNSHEETKSTALKRDEQQVQALVDNLNQAMTDPSNMPYKYIHWYTRYKGGTAFSTHRS